MPPILRSLIAFLALASLAASGAAERLCPGQDVAPMADGRMLGHLPYAEAPTGTLVSAPAGFAIGAPCYVHRDMAPDLNRLLLAAKGTPGVGMALRAVSCFRSVEHQRLVFCSQIGPRKRCANAAERARSVGPPGYSEHATGYAIDFGARPLVGGCGDVNACFAQTPAGRWLIAHAPEYGFELSFPQGNAQGVTWEPWHWRWVGISALEAGADKARALFARARASFPAYPRTPDASPLLAPLPFAIPTPAPTPVINGVPILPPKPKPAPPPSPKPDSPSVD
ncbi:M15 family metallopeptidase [Sphingomonas sp. GlSt437]|uniref:M15 family metallopeptidase n=1 Tax=Sphingomonas sp. GlSt437 TaxID=3389970 RepID=UPI003A8C82F9